MGGSPMQVHFTAYKYRTFQMERGEDYLDDKCEGKHVMLDIETGGHPPNGAILEIAAVGFSPNGPWSVGPVFYRDISIKSNKRWGMAIDEDTLNFWRDQDRSEEVLNGRHNLRPALKALDEFLAPFDKIYAKSPIFDAALVRDAMLITGYTSRDQEHWSFKNRRRLRDVRTALEMAKEFVPQKTRNADLGWPYERCHHPIADCLKQIGDLYEYGVFGTGWLYQSRPAPKPLSEEEILAWRENHPIKPSE